MKQYELTVLVHPDLEMNVALATDKVKALIEANGGKITKENNEGKKRMAYKIRKQDFAVYYFYEIELPANAPKKISEQLNITEEVLRYLLVTVDERKLKYAERAKARAEARGENSEEAENADSADEKSNEEE